MVPKDLTLLDVISQTGRGNLISGERVRSVTLGSLIIQLPLALRNTEALKRVKTAFI